MNRRDKQEIIWMKTWSAGRNWDTDAGRYTESKNRMWLGTVKEWEWSDEATVIYCNKRVRLNILHQQHFYCSWLNILSSLISWSRNWCFSDSCYKLIKEHLQRDKTLKCKRRPPLCSSACRPPPTVSYRDGCSRDPFIFTVMNEYLIRPAVGFEARRGMHLIFPLSDEAGNEQNTSLTTVMLLYFEDEGLNSLSDFIIYKSAIIKLAAHHSHISPTSQHTRFHHHSHSICSWVFPVSLTF